MNYFCKNKITLTVVNIYQIYITIIIRADRETVFVQQYQYLRLAQQEPFTRYIFIENLDKLLKKLKNKLYYIILTGDFNIIIDPITNNLFKLIIKKGLINFIKIFYLNKPEIIIYTQDTQIIDYILISKKSKL